MENLYPESQAIFLNSWLEFERKIAVIIDKEQLDQKFSELQDYSTLSDRENCKIFQ